MKTDCICHCHNNHEGANGLNGIRCKCLPNCEHCNPEGFANTKAKNERIKKTLFIETWYSTCGGCRKGANPHEVTHNTILGYGVKEGEKGCGIKWEYVSTNYAGLNMQARIEEMRPDLKFTGDLML